MEKLIIFPITLCNRLVTFNNANSSDPTEFLKMKKYQVVEITVRVSVLKIYRHIIHDFAGNLISYNLSNVETLNDF